MRTSRRTFAALAATAALAMVPLSCSSNSGDTTADDAGDDAPTAAASPGTPDAQSGASSEPVTISVGGKPTPDKKASLKIFKRTLAQFEDKYPNITVKPTETKWEASTFQAMLAGGTMPTVLGVPFTEPQGLIARKQVADITDQLDQLGLTDQLNPKSLDIVKDADGRIYGVPTAVYSVGLVYNRALFEKAGLDPDSPPTTWDQVRADAKTITAKTDAAGYAMMTTNNTGGWMLTTQTYSFGGTMENAEGTKATFNSQPTKDALTLLQKMRWEDDTMGSNFLYDQQKEAQAFAAGKFAMMMGAPDTYNLAVTNYEMHPKDFGVGPLPQDGGKHGTLSGGSVLVVSPKATDAQKVAALKWIDFTSFRQLKDKSVAVANAKATKADGGVVGLPGLSPLNQKIYDRYQKWIKPYSNVPVENFAPYLEVAKDQTLIPEPPKDAQEVYAALDPVVQAVLTKKDTDIDALLDKAARTIDAKLSR